ncbi:METTL18 [Cordylochernes scorpioides]|uniref:protein-histidine N-methyltransferase n=1 Tax=Cordylochernes scorpioides TaxID=51811 RepID=A0ABY6KKT8_9ARAC|nr:METTL18 [Cordylochernes scorpioides]
MQFSFFPTDEPEDKIEEQQIPVSYSPATEVKITEEHYKAMIIMVVKGFKNLTKLPKFSLTYRRCNNVGKKEIKEQGILSAFSQNSDVVPGVYEGGLKVWDCAYDLLDYLSTNSQLLKSGMKVLELGCGAGLPGIFALCKGANVDFQDFNVDVLRVSTIPNILLNIKSEEWSDLPQRCSFIAGDWGAVADFLEAQQARYDLILTSETIYSLPSQPRLIQAMERLLHPAGKVLLAAKLYYFGVGGTIPQFVELLGKSSSLQSRSAHVVNDVLKREILEITYKPKEE